MATLKKPLQAATTGQNSTTAQSQKSGITMSDKDRENLDSAKRAWEYGNKVGDKVVMETAHRQAENIRAKYGFSGGSDGSQYIPLDGSGAAAQPAAGTTQHAVQNIQQQASPQIAGTGRNVTTDLNAWNTLQQMKNNSSAWHATQDQTERNRLDQLNKNLATQYFPGAYRTDSGVWYYNGLPLYEMIYEAPSASYGTANDDTNLRQAAETMNAARTAGQSQPFIYQGADLSAEKADLARAAQTLANQKELPYTTADLSGMRSALDQAARDAAEQGSFGYTGRDLSRMEAGLDQALAGITNQTPFSYQMKDLSGLERQMNSSRDRIINRAAFAYDPNSDPLYQAYAQQYIRNGQRAMDDTLGKIAARTGGIASSYASSAAAQAYNGYMQELAAKIPELKQVAYQMYMNDLNQNRADYDMLSSQYQSALAADERAREFAYQDYQNQRQNAQWQYGALADRYAQALNQENANRNFAYQQSRDRVGDAQWKYNALADQYAQALAQSNADRAFNLDVNQYNREGAQWDYNAAMERLQQAASQMNADRNFAYQQNRDRVGDAQWNYNALADQYAQALAQYNTDRNFLYGVDRDAIEDRRYNQEFGRQLNRDAEDDRRYNQEWDYGVGRDQISDQRYGTEWAHQVSQDEVDNALRWAAMQLDQQQYGLSQDKFAYQQGQDAIDNALAQNKFAYQQNQDAITNAQAAQRLAMQQAESDKKLKAAADKEAAGKSKEALTYVAKESEKKLATVFKNALKKK